MSHKLWLVTLVGVSILVLKRDPDRGKRSREFVMNVVLEWEEILVLIQNRPKVDSLDSSPNCNLCGVPTEFSC